MLLKYTVRHSMLKIRFGALPVTEVKMPHAPPGKTERLHKQTRARRGRVLTSGEIGLERLVSIKTNANFDAGSRAFF